MIPIRLATVLACLAVLHAADPVATSAWNEVDGVRVPLLRQPVYVMEFHLWAHAPFGPEGRPGWVKNGLCRNEVEREGLGPDWMRNRYQVGQPLVGYYEAGDPDIMRWQLRCLKASGVDGAFIQLYADPQRPETFHRIAVFERMLAIAEEEGVQIAAHDEVQYRDAACKAATARRAGALLARCGRSKAWLRIGGRPAYAFQWWNRWEMPAQGGGVPWPHPRQSLEDLRAMLRAGDDAAGEPVHWMPFHRADDPALLALPEVGSLVAARTFGNLVRPVAGSAAGWSGHSAPGEPLQRWSADPLPPPFTAAQAAELAAGHAAAPGKPLGCWVYAGFNDSTGHAPVERRSTRNFRWIPRQGGRTLADSLAAADAAGADFIQVTSWNDWEENTAIEPGAWYEGDDGDPYRYCRILAAAKGRTFTPPPLPPKEAVDPWMWQRLYGLDRTPPHLARLRWLPMDPALVAEVVDSGSAVAGCGLRTAGDLSWAVVDGAPRGEGLAAVGEPPVRAGALELAAGSTVELAIDPAAIAGESELWLGVEYADRAAGFLRIDHPAAQALVDGAADDERTTQLCSRLPLDADGAWKAECVLLRGVVAGTQPRLRLRLAGPDGSVRSAAGTLSVARIDLFRTARPGSWRAGRAVAGTAEGSQVKSFRLDCPPLDAGEVPPLAWLQAVDAAGNRSHPIPIHRGLFAADLRNLPGRQPERR